MDDFYMPMHAVRKESSSTTTHTQQYSIASAKSSTGVSLIDTILVGPTVHASLVDVLLRFRQHRVALIADVSRMYRAVALPESDRDMHRFVWRTSPNDSRTDYRMTGSVTWITYYTNTRLYVLLSSIQLPYVTYLRAASSSFSQETNTVLMYHLTNSSAIQTPYSSHHLSYVQLQPVWTQPEQNISSPLD